MTLTLFDDIRGSMGERRGRVMLAVLMLLVAACSDSSPPPTLATGTTAPPTTATTTTIAPTTTVATTTSSVPTTEDPDARRAEIEELALDTFVGRMSAIYSNDKNALLDWVGSQAGYEDAAAAIDEGRITFLQAPSRVNLKLLVNEVLLDREDCVVVDVTIEATGVVEGATEPANLLYVYWPEPTGVLLLGAVWESGTPQVQWIEECDIAVRGVQP